MAHADPLFASQVNELIGKVDPSRATAPGSTVRVMLVDDHAILREGLSALLELESDLKVVGQAGSIPEAVENATLLKPDLIITDLSLPGATGMQGIVELRSRAPNARLIGP